MKSYNQYDKINKEEKAKVNQPVLMDLWNNTVGRMLANNSDLQRMTDKELMYYALANY